MTTIFDDLKNAFNRRDNGLVKLILINVIIFVVFKLLYVILFLSGVPHIYELIATQMRMPANAMSFLFRPWTIFTTMFFHEDFFHIIFNMLFFYWFGQIIEEYLGSRRLIALYILGGLAGGILYITAYNLLPVFQAKVAATMLQGASAAVYAVVVAAATLVPNYTFHLLFLGAVRIVYIATFYVFLSVVGVTGANAGGNLAHLGGALLGFLFIRQLQKGNDLGKPVSYVTETVASWFKPKSHIKVSYTNKNRKVDTSKSSVTKPGQAEIDAILDKISHSGYDSLSKEEKQKLFSASQKDE